MSTMGGITLYGVFASMSPSSQVSSDVQILRPHFKSVYILLPPPVEILQHQIAYYIIFDYSVLKLGLSSSRPPSRSLFFYTFPRQGGKRDLARHIGYWLVTVITLQHVSAVQYYSSVFAHTTQQVYPLLWCLQLLAAVLSGCHFDCSCTSLAMTADDASCTKERYGRSRQIPCPSSQDSKMRKRKNKNNGKTADETGHIHRHKSHQAGRLWGAGKAKPQSFFQQKPSCLLLLYRVFVRLTCTP